MDFNLPLFPFDSTAITVTTTVWVGVLISVFFNLRLGWTLSGLVVPGFLVPLMVARPITAVVILFEAVLTYWIVYLLSEGPRKLSYWSSFFGRDRFFVILLVSVLVRVAFDGYIFPWVGQTAIEEYGINFDYKNNLQSYGLIIVALIANYFWKPGVCRGIPPIATCVLLTYVVVQGLLVPHTNFSVANYHLLYEDITTSMLASPKAYIIVLTTSYLASWMNLRYAWDFNGILIPALLGLLWHEPVKILVSGAECMMLCYVASLLLKTPLFRRMTIQGGRKILFFFSICFAYRLLASHLYEAFLPTWNATDAFGYGYLLSTLMAIKIHDKQKSLRMLVGTGKISMLGAVVGSLIGFGFFCGPKINFSFAAPAATNSAETVPHEGVIYSTESLTKLLRRDKTLLYEKRQAESYVVPTDEERARFRTAIQLLKQTGSNPDRDDIDVAAKVLHHLNYRTTIVNKRYVYLHERSPSNGWGMYVIDTKNPNGVCVQVPAPLGEWSTLESGISMLKLTPSCALAIAGAPRDVNYGGDADVLNSDSTMFQVFQDVYQHSSVLQVRGYTRSAYRQLTNASSGNAQQKMESAQSRLYIRGDIPKQINLSTLKELSGSLDVRWNPSPLDNRLRGQTSASFIEMFLNRTDRRRLVGQQSKHAADIQGEDHSNTLQCVSSSIRDWLLKAKERIIPQASNLYVPAKVEDMLYMDQEVFAPLIATLGAVAPSDAMHDLTWLNEAIKSELQSIHAAAAAHDYGITIVCDSDNDGCYVVVSESNAKKVKGWGTFVFRPGLVDPYAIEIPRPLFESRSFDFGVNLLERPRCSALIIAGAHPRANMDGSSDISKAANKTNLFNLVRHVLLRHTGDRPFLIAQARAIQAPVEADIVVATDDGATLKTEMSPLKDHLLQQLTEDQLSIAFVDGRHETAGYELGVLMQATSVQVSQNKEVVSLWLSPSLRTKFREQSENRAMTAQFDACGIKTVQQKLTAYLSKWSTVAMNRSNLPSQKLQEDLEHYAVSFDVVRLLAIVRNNPDWDFVRVLDAATGQSFLSISSDNESFPTVINVTGAIGNNVIAIEKYDRDAIRRFIRSRSLWLQHRTNPSAESQLISRALEAAQ